ncbi:hypothetical protein PF010_g29395 [Phytophthora fragariae]|uniref:Uncharacterized protein n=1 Tax=Phytophthora fragariae TaxID=53985 RepID=A0A6A3Q5L9_9STRA|nr:hypothetical protein PF010_g29395 [Phytophthora fragariae]KAE9069380.1 hypothetical protein PF006_g29588 [Phytophthora fragariae]
MHSLQYLLAGCFWCRIVRQVRAASSSSCSWTSCCAYIYNYTHCNNKVSPSSCLCGM